MTEKVNRLPAWQAYCELPDGTLVVQATEYAHLEQECKDAKCQAELMQRAAEVFREERDAALKQVEGLRDALSGLLNCQANVVQATVPRAGVEAATPYQVVLDVSVSLTRWRKAQEALSAKP